MKMLMHCRLRTLLPLLALLASAGSLHAGLIATNEFITTMDATGGTEVDPNIYVFDNYAKTFSTFTVGNANPWNQLQIINGADVEATAGPCNIGSGIGGTNCLIRVSGTGASLIFRSEIRVGDKGNYSRLEIENGATAMVVGQWTIGYRNVEGQGNFNSLVVDGGSLVISNKLNIGYNVNNICNSLVVKNGASCLLAGSGRIVIGRYGASNDVSVIGRPSILHAESTSSGLSIPENGATGYGHHDTLTIVDEALVQIDNASTTAVSVKTTGEGGNYVRLAKGFLAWYGNRTANLSVTTQVALWDGSQYVTPADANEADALKWNATYYTSEQETEAYNATGYSGLAGYTVFTGGQSISGALSTTLIVIQ
jgi:hypothetical protein